MDRVPGIQTQSQLRRREAIAVEGRLEEERQVVVELQRVAGANLVEDKEAPVPCAHHERLGRERAVRKADAWSEVVLVGGIQVLRITPRAVRTPSGFPLGCNRNCSGDAGLRTAESRSRSEPKVQGQIRSRPVRVLHEMPRRCAGDCRSRPRRNGGSNRQAHQHVGQGIAAATPMEPESGRKLTAERKLASGLAHLQQVELVKADLRPQPEPVFPVHKAERVVNLEILGGPPGRRKQRFAEPGVRAEIEPSQAIDE